jgi:hypothetical protein
MNLKSPPPLGEGPILSPNFANDVLKKADMLMARRRRVRGAVGGLGTVCVVAAAVFIGYRAYLPTSNRPDLQPNQNIAVNDRAISSQADALAYMFPDAAPLAQLDDNYFSTVSTADDPLSTDPAGGENDE